MSYQTTTCVMIDCDACQITYPDDDEVMHFNEEAEAWQYAAESGWWVTPELAWCDGCRYVVEHTHIWHDETCIICLKDVEDAE